MKVVISNKVNSNNFVTIFHHLNSLTECVELMFLENSVYLQSMDSSHVCLFELLLDKSWFDSYEFCETDQKNIAINTNIFYKIINTKQENQHITLHYDGNPEKLLVEFTSKDKNEFDKYFEVNLMDLVSDHLDIPKCEYSAEMVINTKTFHAITSQLLIFNEVVNVYCSEDKIIFTAAGHEGTMKVPIPIDDLDEFAIEEDSTISVEFSLSYFNKLCLFHRITSEVKLEFSEDYPMLMTYNLDENSYLRFFLAPRVTE